MTPAIVQLNSQGGIVQIVPRDGQFHTAYQLMVRDLPLKTEVDDKSSPIKVVTLSHLSWLRRQETQDTLQAIFDCWVGKSDCPYIPNCKLQLAKLSQTDFVKGERTVMRLPTEQVWDGINAALINAQ